jgi:hypothetical protein
MSLRVACALVLGISATAAAADIEVSLSSPLSYGEPVTMTVELLNPERGIEAPRPLPQVDGLKIEGPYGPQSTQSVQVINGRQTVKTSLVYQYVVQPQPGRTGDFTLGPVTFPRKGGQPLQSDSVRLSVWRRPEPGAKVTATLGAPLGPIGRPFEVLYTVRYPADEVAPRRRLSVFDNEFPLKELQIPLLKLPGLRATSVASRKDLAANTLRLEGREITFQQGFVAEDGSGYRTLLIAFEVVPMRPGKLDVGGVKATLSLATGRTVLRRDFFSGTQRVAEMDLFEGVCPTAEYSVQPLPAAGQPPGFSGAIGRYTLDVSTQDTTVDAFAPVTLEVRVRGEGLDESLPAPAWHTLDALRKDFDVSPDVDAGRLEGDAKVFRQVIRPLHEKVKAIPALPFPFYDPWKAEYSVAYSKPIAITVRAARSVGAAEAIVSPQPQTAPQAEASRPAAVADASGIPANFAELGTAVSSPDYRRSLRGAPFLLALSLPPLGYLAVLLVLRLRSRDPSQVVRQRALRRAEHALSAAGLDAEAASAAYQDYFRDRLGLPPGEVTPAQLRAALEARHVPIELAGSAVAELEALLAGRFGGAAEAPEALAARSLEVIRKIERCRVR